jgi:predicted MPP superfamily phosphohydrolase
VWLADLPREHDGLTLVAISDMHLGTLLGERWMSRLIARVNELQPDLVVVVGDVVDGSVDHVETLVPTLKKLRAPHGVWAVTGNHEYYAGLDRSVAVLEAAGCRLLRNRWAEAVPGLVVAGVDDLTAGQQFGLKGCSFEEALANRPRSPVILLSHTPWQPDRAAVLGVVLMLSGHTHNGQVWPFNVRRQIQK